MTKTSSYTRVTLDLGTGEQCLERPPNLSHLSDSHFEGLRNAINEEYENRKEESGSSYTLKEKDEEVFQKYRKDMSDSVESAYDGCLGSS